MAWTHYFDEEFAVKHGLHKAIVYEKLRQWIRSNAATGRNQIDGKTWTYGSKKSWQVQLPFLTEKQIRSALDGLREDGIIVAASHSPQSWNRTLWYALADETGIEVVVVEDASALRGQGSQPSEADPLALQGQSSTTTPPMDNSSNGQHLPSPPAPARKAPKHSPEEISLSKQIGDLTTERGGHWAASGKEVAAVWKLIGWGKLQANGGAEKYLLDFLDGAWALHEGTVIGVRQRDADFWRQQPYTPSSLLCHASRIVAVLESIEQANRPLTAEQMHWATMGMK